MIGPANRYAKRRYVSGMKERAAVKEVRKEGHILRKMLIDYGSFTGAIVGAVGTIVAGAAAWQGVQEQISAQVSSNKISERNVLVIEIDRNTKRYQTLSDIINYWNWFLRIEDYVVLKQYKPEDLFALRNFTADIWMRKVAEGNETTFQKIREELPGVDGEHTINLINFAKQIMEITKNGTVFDPNNRYSIVANAVLENYVKWGRPILWKLLEEQSELDSLIQSDRKRLRSLKGLI